MYVADGPTEASVWRPADDLSVEACNDTAPALRFTSRSGQPLSSEMHHAVERADVVLVVTDMGASYSRNASVVGAWRAVVLLPAA